MGLALKNGGGVSQTKGGGDRSIFYNKKGGVGQRGWQTSTETGGLGCYDLVF